MLTAPAARLRSGARSETALQASSSWGRTSRSFCLACQLASVRIVLCADHPWRRMRIAVDTGRPLAVISLAAWNGSRRLEVLRVVIYVVGTLNLTCVATRPAIMPAIATADRLASRDSSLRPSRAINSLLLA
jgi:hypothetical protein